MKSKDAQLSIGWKVASLAGNMASVRYRALMPLLALEDEGCRCQIFSDPNSANLNDIDVLVLVKTFTTNDYILAKDAVSRNIPVIFDLCDNIFIDSYGEKEGRVAHEVRELFLALAGLAQAVVVPTDRLADVVRKSLAERVPVFVIPDGVETLPLMSRSLSRLIEAVKLERRHYVKQMGRRVRGMAISIVLKPKQSVYSLLLLVRKIENYLDWRRLAKAGYRHYDKLRSVLTDQPRRVASNRRGGMDGSFKRQYRLLKDLVYIQALNQRAYRESRGADSQCQVNRTEARAAGADVELPNKKVILWFGNHGAPHARFGMLDLLEIKKELETIATEYSVELVVISNNEHKYSRHIMPLAIPSRYVEWSNVAVYKQLEKAAVVVIPNTRDPFSLCKSANRSVLALAHGVPVVATLTPALEVFKGSIVFDDFLRGLRLYLSDGVAAESDVAKAKSIIEDVFGQKTIARKWRAVFSTALLDRKDADQEERLVVVVHLVQDLDLVLPVVDAAMRNGIQVRIICSASLVMHFPWIKKKLDATGARVQVLSGDVEDYSAFTFPESTAAVLTASETNLKPHRLTRVLTESAKKQAILTATMQHGLENVGLTYGDRIQPLHGVNFAADRIYIWGSARTLHSAVTSATRAKCISVGCPKPVDRRKKALPIDISRFRSVIGIFENLHWHRYDHDYRVRFLEGVESVTRSFGDMLFLIRPHQAGMWLTGRYKGKVPSGNNVAIVDSASSPWQGYAAQDLLGALGAVITTPSTVALDAARQGLPVAVVPDTPELVMYSPLPTINCLDDWGRFVRNLDDADMLREYGALSKEFSDRMVVPGDAAERIVNDLFGVGQSVLRRGRV